MRDYKEHTQVIEIPKGTGIRGFLRAIEEILKLERVQSISIDARGQVSYTRFVRENDGDLDVTPKLNFENLMPWAVIRNGVVSELTIPSQIHPATAVGRMFAEVSKRGFYPVAFVTGAATTLFDWMGSAGLAPENKDEFFGLPLLKDRMVDDYVLILAATYGRGANFADTQHSIKIVMPQRDHALTSDRHHQVGDLALGNTPGVRAVGIPGRTNGAPPSKPGGGNSGNRGGAAE